MNLFSATMLLLVNLFSQTSNQVIKVSIDYKSHYPAFKSKILPAYMKMGRQLKLDSRPHGISAMADDVKGNNAFKCIRGSENFPGNILQTCVLNSRNGRDKLKIVYLFKDSTRSRGATDHFQSADETQVDKNPIGKKCKPGQQTILIHLSEGSCHHKSSNSAPPKLELNVKVVASRQKIPSKKLRKSLNDVPVCRNYRLSRSSDRDINPDTIDKTLIEMYNNLSQEFNLIKPQTLTSETHNNITPPKRKFRFWLEWAKDALYATTNLAKKVVTGVIEDVVQPVVGIVVDTVEIVIDAADSTIEAVRNRTTTPGRNREKPIDLPDCDSDE